MAKAAARSAAPARSPKGAPPVAWRRGAPGGARAPAATAAPASIRDPRFRKVMDRLGHSAAKARTHVPAAQKAAEAEAAAKPPPNERLAGAKSKQVDAMGGAPTGKVQPTSFLETLRAAIREVMPKKTEDAGDYMKGDDRGRLQGAVSGNVQQQKDETTAGMKGASAEKPDASRVPEQPATPMPEPPVPGAPPVAAAEAMPAPKPAAEVSFDENRRSSDKLLADNQLTGPQLEKANDPRFSAVLTTKGEADRLAEKAPGQYRGREQGVLAAAGKQAGADEQKGLLGMHATARGSAGKVKVHQQTAREKDEAARKAVADHIEGLYARTKQAVDDKLAALDKEVEQVFGQGVDRAIERMKDYVETRFDDRYSGLSGKALWLKDKLLPLPAKVKRWFDEAQAAFTQDLDDLVVRIAALVEKRLAEAKSLIDGGQKEIKDYVAGLPASLKATGEAAEKEMNSRFDELRRGVEDKKGDLARSLATRYKDATEKGAKALQELKDAHKSLYEKVRDAVLTVVRILREFKDRVLALLKKAAGVIGIIVGDPIGFLGNILAAIKKGLGQFVDNIWTHLKTGFITWLLGSLADTGITMPKDLSLPSLLRLALQVLGLTYDRIRARAVVLIGERNVAVIEKVATALKVLITEGPAKLWEMMKEWVGDLKTMIVDAIQDWLITTIVKAAITKLVSMFNPVGAIIQAILMIYNVVMFLIENIKRILEFVESVVNSVVEIANGAIGTAANFIEKALARMVPILIGFLARLLGISGITDKIISTIKKVQGKVEQAVDKVIGKLAAFGGKAMDAAKAGASKVAEWWKQHKPFKTAGGAKHEVYFTGEPKNLTAMVASGDPQPVERRLDRFAAQAQEAGATADQKKATGLIASTRSAVKKNPDDPKVVSGLQSLFEIFEESGTKKDTKLTHKTGSLGGDTVGVGMTIDWLGATWAAKNPGTPPKSGVQDTLMSKLETDPSERSPDKYIRGHLLNEHIGGKGDANNLFPITANANSRHLHSTESRIKTWVLDKKQWARYEVNVSRGATKLDSSDITQNYVDAKFDCTVVLKDAAGKESERFLTTITSQHGQRHEAAKFTVK